MGTPIKQVFKVSRWSVMEKGGRHQKGQNQTWQTGSLPGNVSINIEKWHRFTEMQIHHFNYYYLHLPTTDPLYDGQPGFHG